MHSKHIIFAHSFDHNGLSKKLDNNLVAKELENDGLCWVHLDASSKQTRNWLEKEVIYLDHLIVDALLAEEARPRIVEFDKGILIILRAVNFNKGSNPEDMVSIRIWIDSCRIITIQRRNVKSAFTISENINSGKLIKNSGELLYNLLYETLSDISTFIYGVSESLDSLEQKVTSTHDMIFREQVIKARSQSAVLKRHLIPQREVIRKLQTVEHSFINEWARRHFQENYENIAGMIEEAEEAKDRSQILHDELSNALSEKLNRSMYKLSIITSIFMPLTFVTGIFGMNIGGVPGIGNSEAFNFCMFGMLLIFLLQMLFFKRGKWF